MDNIDVDSIVQFIESLVPVFSFFQKIAEWISDNLFGKIPGLIDSTSGLVSKVTGWIATLTAKK
ncbi:MAG: hypothetical protein LBG83_05180 [Oscillospiraceae bacterium]|jgi:hypothetical protein|nr:hypothetical protein [Oscillospiraceae bacterium]